MSNYEFSFASSGSSTKIPNRVEGDLAGAAAALRAFCVCGEETNTKHLYYRIGDEIKNNIDLPQEGVVLLLAAAEGMYGIRACIDKRISGATYAEDMTNTTTKDRDWLLENRADREEALSELRKLNNKDGKFEVARQNAERRYREDGVACWDNAQAFGKPEDWDYIPKEVKQECNGMLAYLDAIYEELKSDKQKSAFYRNLLRFPEFSAWLLSAMYTINLARGCIWNVADSKADLPAASDLLAEVFSKAKTTQGLEVSDERWQKFAGIYTEVVKSVYRAYCTNKSDYDEKGPNARAFH